MIHIPYYVNGSEYVTDGTNFYVQAQDASDMTLNLFKFTGEPTRVDKTAYLTAVDTLTGTLREECSIIRPSIVIQYAGMFPDANYVYIPIFKRYYYIRNITSVRTGLWRIECEVDPLMTYLSGILALNAYVARQEFDYNDDLVDNQLPCEKQSEILVIDPSSGYDTGTFNNQLADGAHNFVLTVVGA